MTIALVSLAELMAITLRLQMLGPQSDSRRAGWRRTRSTS